MSAQQQQINRGQYIGDRAQLDRLPAAQTIAIEKVRLLLGQAKDAIDNILEQVGMEAEVALRITKAEQPHEHH